MASAGLLDGKKNDQLSEAANAAGLKGLFLSISPLLFFIVHYTVVPFYSSFAEAAFVFFRPHVHK